MNYVDIFRFRGWQFSLTFFDHRYSGGFTAGFGVGVDWHKKHRSVGVRLFCFDFDLVAVY